MSRMIFPEGSLLAALSGPEAPPEGRRLARHLRAEGAPAVAIGPGIIALAEGLALSEVAHSPAVPEALPPLCWIEAGPVEGAGALAGWVVERRGDGLAARGFGRDLGPPEAILLAFSGRRREEEPAVRRLRGLATALSLPGVMAEMGESAPILLMPAEAAGPEATLLRGLRLSLALLRDAVP
ncbi:hypothetical protein NON00_01940 [Roseomonas sp. GC11]|uniref:hypothetical protein n=1 Tax=Roseomonas sp. GC11 TaxID=2950546 RepID=UPI00210BDA64|nr:hypothetical protein [Roseomonas sp. GC11]MCQ4158688.1 hypothetical protein [Roseomonas sp. GC11]